MDNVYNAYSQKYLQTGGFPEAKSFKETIIDMSGWDWLAVIILFALMIASSVFAAKTKKKLESDKNNNKLKLTHTNFTLGAVFSAFGFLFYSGMMFYI